MDDSSNPTPPPPGRRSAVEELNELLGISPAQPASSVVQESTPAAPSQGISPSMVSTAPSLDLSAIPASEPQITEQHSSILASADPVDSSTFLPMAGHASAIDQLQDIVDNVFSTPSQQAVQTIAPADISSQAPQAAGSLMPSLLLPTAVPSRPSIPQPEALGLPEMAPLPISEGSIVEGPQEANLGEYIVTLPLHAASRTIYNDIQKSFKQEIKDFTSQFQGDGSEPSVELTQRIDEMLGQLQSTCDYPPHIAGSTFANFNATEKARYAMGSNSKFNFIQKLLEKTEKDMRILIVARSVDLLRLLAAVAESLGLDCDCSSLNLPQPAERGSRLKVTLALADTPVDLTALDIVIAYDGAFNGSPLSWALSARSPSLQSPMVLVLRTTYTLEHVDLELPSGLDRLSRKAAMVAALARARTYITDPPPMRWVPTKAARAFIDFFNGDKDTVMWEATKFPPIILDIFETSPGDSGEEESGGSRKRKLDETNSEEAKRQRLLPIEPSTVEHEEPPMPDSVAELLQKAREINPASDAHQSQLRVPVTLMETVAEMMASKDEEVSRVDDGQQYRAVLDQLDTRVKEYERTSELTYRKMRAAIEERSQSEKEKLAAEKALTAGLKTAEEAASKAKAKAEKTIAEMQTNIHNLLSRLGQGEGADIARSEKSLEEAKEKIAHLEKRLANADQDKSYVWDQYNVAKNAADTAQSESSELRERVAVLEGRASENLRQVQQIHSEQSSTSQTIQIAELQARLREREADVDRLREEMRLMARNGRRDTRGASVPRSPGMGINSPRAPGRYAQSASRGSSPNALEVPPGIGSFLAQGDKGRLSHLRD